jgi:pSer/pThr/pTyr-binding forkhead associated (FHA) protein
MASPPDSRPTVPDPLRPRDKTDRPPAALWAEGEFTLRIRDGAVERTFTIRRPYALVGRISGADLCIEDRAVSARHAYLHLDRRGLFGVDLATRTGTRFGENGQSAGWLRPGQGFEIAGRRIELLDLHVTSGAPEPGPSSAADPLADAAGAPLLAVTLHAMHARQAPRTLGSELVFVGRSSACGVRVEGATASRVHCVLVRTAPAAYVVDLIGRGTWLNGQMVAGAAPLSDSDILVVGSAQFRVRVGASAVPLPALTPRPAPLAPWLAEPSGVPAPVVPASSGLAPALDALPPDSQGAILAWMMSALQASQAEALRRQGEFQLALTQLVQQLQHDHNTLFHEQLERMKRIDEELTALRAELQRRFGATARPPAFPTDLPPLRLNPSPPRPPDTDPAASAAWLLSRVNELENEHQSAWKDLLGRLGKVPRKPS